MTFRLRGLDIGLLRIASLLTFLSPLYIIDGQGPA